MVGMMIEDGCGDCGVPFQYYRRRRPSAQRVVEWRNNMKANIGTGDRLVEVPLADIDEDPENSIQEPGWRA